MALRVAVYFVGIIGLLFLYIKYIESRSIFFPTKNLEVTPKEYGFDFQDIYLTTTDNQKIHGWFIPYPQAEYTILFCHGNGGNIAQRLEKIALLRKTKSNVFIIDYRGYGKSSGKPSEQGIYRDAQAAYDYLVNKQAIRPQQIILYGESLGGAVAVDLAYHRQVRAIILEGVFSSGKDIGKRFYPYLPRLMLPNIFNSLEKIKTISASKLFIHSKSDEVVPFDLGEKLYKASPSPKEFVTVVGGHNTSFIDSQSEYISAIIKFVEGLAEEK